MAGLFPLTVAGPRQLLTDFPVMPFGHPARLLQSDIELGLARNLTLHAAQAQTCSPVRAFSARAATSAATITAVSAHQAVTARAAWKTVAELAVALLPLFFDLERETRRCRNAADAGHALGARMALPAQRQRAAHTLRLPSPARQREVTEHIGAAPLGVGFTRLEETDEARRHGIGFGARHRRAITSSTGRPCWLPRDTKRKPSPAARLAT